MVAQSKENVARIVQEYLKQDPTVGKAVRVVAEDVRLGDEADLWWWVPVVFDPDPYKRYYYFELFSGIEEALEAKEHINVLLVPRAQSSLESPL